MLDKQKIITYALMGLGVIVLVTLSYFLRPERETIMPLPPQVKEEEPSTMIIDIKGEIKNPGVYKVKTGARLYEVINLAGGLTIHANLYAINLALILQDQSSIIIPHKEESIEEKDPYKLISISEAEHIVLVTLPNIGPATAQAIIDYRETHGPFETIEDIMNVRGIGVATFDAIKDLIRP